MATLSEIWAAGRRNVCLVAYRAGSLHYVALGHATARIAFDAAREKQGLDDEDRAADDWRVGEVVPWEDADALAGTCAPEVVGTPRGFR